MAETEFIPAWACVNRLECHELLNNKRKLDIVIAVRKRYVIANLIGLVTYSAFFTD